MSLPDDDPDEWPGETVVGAMESLDQHVQAVYAEVQRNLARKDKDVRWVRLLKLAHRASVESTATVRYFRMPITEREERDAIARRLLDEHADA